jgi:hypothetical protein
MTLLSSVIPTEQNMYFRLKKEAEPALETLYFQFIILNDGSSPEKQ